MIVAIFVSLLAVLFAYMARYHSGNHWLKLSMLILTVFLSISYNWGSDVSAYQNLFYIYNGGIGDISAFDVSTGGAIADKGEYGWIILNKLCVGVGFWGMRILLFCFENYVIYRLIKHYVSRDYYWMAIFFFTFNNSFMVLGSSMMRQYLAMCIVALGLDIAIQIIKHNKSRRFLLWGSLFYFMLVIAASYFHRSALLALPAIMVFYLRFNFSTRNIILLIFFAVVWFAFGYSLMLAPMEGLMAGYFDSYSGYVSTMGTIGFGVAFQVLMYIFVLSNYKSLTREQRILSTYAAISILLLPYVVVYEFVTRVVLYFSLLSIVVFPIFFKSVEKKNLKILIIPLILIMLFGYWSFFHNEIWRRTYYNYTTIFSIVGWQ